MPAEWLVRKLFNMPKPPKGKAKTRGVRKTAEAQEPVKNEPIVTAPDAAASAAATVATAKPAVSGQSMPPLQATREAEPQPKHQPAPSAPTGDGKPPSILNFRAWFMADPVKSALLIGLSFLSWLATYTGMLELIQANAGQLEIFARIAIGFSVMMLMLMILYLLDSLYSNGTPTWLKPVFVAGYAFLTLISVGFGFGFYWKYLEAQTEATRSAESAVSQVQVSLQLGQTRLEQLQDTFTQLAVLSKAKAEQERDHGNTCPNSRPGEGPRMRLRDEDSQKFGYAAEYITSRVGTVKTDLQALNGDLAKVVSRDASTVAADGTRNEFLRGLGRKLDMTIARFNALATDPQIKQFRDSFDQRAGTTVFPNGDRGTFSCPDTQLQTALKGVVRAIDDIPEIKNPKVAAVEGSEAIVEAFRRLATTLAALPTLKLPPSPEELRKQRTAAISAGKANAEVSNVEPGLSGRDYIPLSAAIFVDLCILLISLNRRNDQFDEFHRSVAAAKTGHIGNTMLEIFEAHQNEISRPVLEKFHHAEFEFGRDYYLAVPLFKGSSEAAYLAEIQAKEMEIMRSKQEALAESIGIHEHELQRRTADQTEAERMKKQIIDYLSAMNGSRARLQQSQKQLVLSYQQHPQQQQALAQQLGGIEQKLATYNTQIGMLEKELDGANRLLHGSGELVRQSKQDLTQLKQKKTQLHEEEQDQLKKRIGVAAELDLAEDARFLSNLCVSLEANNILQLTGLWPTQKQVREKLKGHNSRYYHPERNYRVYRFRKVADNQSQMVLDLIMEAARRARESGELTRSGSKHADKQGSPAEAPKQSEPTPEMLELERQKQEMAEARAAMDAQMLSFRSELGTLVGLMQQQVQASTVAAAAAAQAAASGQPQHSPIDHGAADVFYTDLGKKQRTRQADPAEQARSREIRQKIAERFGGGTVDNMHDFASRGEAISSSLDELGAQIRQQIEGGNVTATGSAVRREAPMYGITGGMSAARSAFGKLASLTSRLRAGQEVGSDEWSASEPKLSAPAAEVTSAAASKAPPVDTSHDPEPEPEAVVAPSASYELRAEPREQPVVAASSERAARPQQPDDRRDRVNFGSLSAPHAVTPAKTAVEVEAAAAATEVETVEEEPAAAMAAADVVAVEAVEIEVAPAEAAAAVEAASIDAARRESLSGRVNRMREAQTNHAADAVRTHEVLMAENVSAAVAELAAGEAPVGEGGLASRKLTHAVRVEKPSIGLNQDDEDDEPRPLVRDLNEDDEPSEADHFEEGALPGFLRGDAMDELSEEMRIQAMAKRFSPTTKGD